MVYTRVAAIRYTACMMQWSPGLDRAPPRRTLVQWCDMVMPGWQPAAVRRLRGGLDTAMHAVDLIGPAGERRRVVVKRFDPLHIHTDEVAVSCRRMWQVLTAAERLGLPAPRPVWIDPDGRTLGSAALVLTWVPGRVVWQPSDPRRWAERMANALAAIHRAPLDGVDLGLLPRVDRQVEQELTALEHNPTAVADHPDGPRLLAALRRFRPSGHGGRAALTHGDFHVGNVLWRWGRLEAVLDWDHAAVGDPGFDVGMSRVALTLQHSPAAAEDFLRTYEAAVGGPVTQLVLWDMLAAALAVHYFDFWVASIDAFGRHDLTAADLRRRLDRFITAALRDGSRAGEPGIPGGE